MKSTNFTEHNGGYGYLCNCGAKIPVVFGYGISAKRNDTVTMHINMDASTLRYSVNDEDQEIAFWELLKQNIKQLYIQLLKVQLLN